MLTIEATINNQLRRSRAYDYAIPWIGTLNLLGLGCSARPC